MKKTGLILLIGIYSLATLGVSLKGFYCCGILKSVSLSLSGKAKQESDKDIAKDGCCKSTYRFFKINEKHIAAHEISSPVNYFTFIHFFIIVPGKASFLYCQRTDVANSNHAPPLYNGVQIYLSKCVFRI